MAKFEPLAFLESANEGSEYNTIGGFAAAKVDNSFDACFENAINVLQGKNVDYFMDISQLLRNPAMMEVFKESALASLKQECSERNDPEKWGNYSNQYEQISAIWDNCTKDYVKESASTGNMMPIKAIDYPILVKQQVMLATKDILQTEVVSGPIIKKQIEQMWVIDDQTKQRWKYPQCFYTDEYREIWKAGKGIPLSEDPQPLPLYKFNIADKLTDVAVPEREQFTLDLKIVKGLLEDGTEVPLDMWINVHSGQWMGGKVNYTYTDEEGEEQTVEDSLTGEIDFINWNVNVTSASGQIKKVVFQGYLSNEKNERHVSFDWTREEREFHIEDGHRAFMPFSIEQLEDYKALVKVDLYKKTYDELAKYLTQTEDSQVIDYLDEMFEKMEGVEIDPLD